MHPVFLLKSPFENSVNTLTVWSWLWCGGLTEPHTEQNTVFTALWELRVWQDLFLGQEGLVVTAVDNQLEWKRGRQYHRCQLTENGNSKNGAVAPCLYRAVSTTEELGESVSVLIPKLRILEQAFLNISPNEGPFLLSQKYTLTEVHKRRETGKRVYTLYL